MHFKIGLDFGTTTSIISYLKDGKPSRFYYGGETEDGTPYVPTVVLYEENDLQIGQYAVEFDNAEGSSVVERYFKLRLSENANDTELRSAQNLTADFIGEFIKGNCPGRKKFGGQRNALAFTTFLNADVESLIIAIPHSWESEKQSVARDRLHKAVIEDLDLPLNGFTSEPEAAAAYFSYCYKNIHDEFFNGNLLVCDMGGGTFDVTLCCVGINSITHIVKEGSTNADGFGIAGHHFDRALIKNCYGELEPSVFSDVMTALDREKKTRNNSRKLTRVLDGTSPKSSPIYRLRDKVIRIDDLENAFSDIKESICEILQKIIAKAKAKEESIDKIILVGGFSKFPLVQRTIRAFVNEAGYDADKLLDFETLTTDDMAYAISYGACLIANDLIETTEKYRNSISICVTDALGEEQKIELIKSGTSLGKLERCVLSADNEGRKIPFRVERKSFQAEFDIVLNDDKTFLKMENFNFPDESDPKGRVFFIGARVDKYSVPYLVLQDEKSGENFPFSLEPIVTEPNNYE